MRLLMFWTLSAVFSVSAFAEADFRNFELNGFRLGMKKDAYMPLIKETCTYNQGGFRGLLTFEVGETRTKGAMRFVCRPNREEELDILTGDDFGILQIIRSKEFSLPENLPTEEHYNSIMKIKEKVMEKYGAPVMSKTAAPGQYFFANVGQNIFPWNVRSSQATAISCWGDCSDSETDTDGVINLKGSGALAVLVPYPRTIYLYQIIVDREAVQKTEAAYERKMEENKAVQENKAIEDARKSMENIQL